MQVLAGEQLRLFSLLWQVPRYTGVTEEEMGIQACRGCRVARYCSPACQRDHRRAHRSTCNAQQAVRNDDHGLESDPTTDTDALPTRQL